MSHNPPRKSEPTARSKLLEAMRKYYRRIVKERDSSSDLP